MLATHWPHPSGVEAPSIWTLGVVDNSPLKRITDHIVSFPGDPLDPSLAAALIAQMLGAGVRGRVLCILGDPDLPDVASRLTDAGVQVDTVAVYRAELVSDVELLATLERAEVLVVASPGVVDALVSQGRTRNYPHGSPWGDRRPSDVVRAKCR